MLSTGHEKHTFPTPDAAVWNRCQVASNRGWPSNARTLRTMKPRATAQLAQLSDGDFVASVADGLSHIGSWIDDLERWATQLAHDEAAGADVLRVIADEEAGKFLILVDAVRCPRTDGKTRSRQLKRCHDHLAKGIYSEACDYRPPTYGKLLDYIHPMRVSHYLDGPNDVDWIFRNQIEARREERLYVDYVSTDDGAEWWEPNRHDDARFGSYPSSAVEIVNALRRAGATSQPGLRVIADVWRPFRIEPGTTYDELTQAISETLEQFVRRGYAAELLDQDAARLVDQWPFPLYGADLSMIDINIDDLREQQRDWSPY
jgi:hypothetical protein